MALDKNIDGINERFRDGTMTEEDWDLTNFATAMFTATNSMEGKLRSIWAAADYLIRKCEESRLPILIRGWPAESKRVVDMSSLESKAEILHTVKLPSKPSALATAYLDVLKAIRLIRSKLVFLESDSSGTRDQSTMDQIASKDLLGNPRFQDQLVVLFFPLQLYCFLLFQMLESAPGTQAGKAKGSQKASKGGEAGKHGEDKFKSMYQDYFEKLSTDKKFRTIDRMWVELYDPLFAIFTSYQEMLGDEWEGKPITFGRTQTADNMPKLLKRWTKESPDFAQLLDRFIQPR